MEFKYDEVAVLQLAEENAQQGTVPRYGMMSGVGIRNPPGFIFLLLPWVAIRASPLAIGGLIVFLNVLAIWLMLRVGRTLACEVAGRWGAAFMAVQPWLILYSRKIWAQSVLPLFVLLVLWLMVIVRARPGTRAVFWLLPVLALAWQIHFSAWCLVLIALAWLVCTAARGRLSIRWALAGTLPALILFAPYLHHLTTSGFAELRAQAQVGGRAGLENVVDVLRAWAQTIFAGGFGQVGSTGPASLATLLPPPIGMLLEILAWLGTVALLTLVVFEFSGAGVRQDSLPAIDSAGEDRKATLHHDIRRGLRPWLALVALLPPVLYAARGIIAPPHYFIIGLPALFLLAGLGAERLGDRLRAHALAAWLPGSIVMICGLAVWLGVLTFIRNAGGTGGDYGIAYRHQAAAAQVLTRAGVAPHQVDATLMRDDGIGVLFLQNRLLPESAGHANGSAKLVDTLRYPQYARTPFAAGWHEERVGPLRIGLAPAAVRATPQP